MKRRRKERGGGGERVKLDGEEREGKRKDIQKQVSCQLELHVSPLLPSSLPSPPPFSSSSSPSTQLSGAELSPCNLNTHAVNQLPKFLSFSLILFLLYFLSPFPFSHFNSFFLISVLPYFSIFFQSLLSLCTFSHFLFSLYLFFISLFLLPLFLPSFLQFSLLSPLTASFFLPSFLPSSSTPPPLLLHFLVFSFLLLLRSWCTKSLTSIDPLPHVNTSSMASLNINNPSLTTSITDNNRLGRN